MFQFILLCYKNCKFMIGFCSFGGALRKELLYKRSRTDHQDHRRNILVRKHYYNVRYSANALNIRSRGFDRAQYCIALCMVEYVNQI